MVGDEERPGDGGARASASPWTTSSALENARLAFVVLLVFNAFGVAMALLGEGPDAASALVVLVALTAWLIVGWWRRGFPRGGELVEVALLAVYVGLTSSDDLSLGLAFPIVMFRSMYGSRVAAWARPTGYALVYVVERLGAAATLTTEIVITSAVLVVGMVFTSLVIHHLRGVLRDLENNERLARQNLEQLQQLEHMKNAFLTATSHELRTPVTVVQGLAEIVALRDQELPADQRAQLLHRLVTHSRRLSDLLDDLLDVDRLTRSSIEAERRPVDLVPLVADTVAALEIEPELVRVPDGQLIAHVDPMMLERIVENLVGNAVKYAGDHPIEVHLEREEDRVVLAFEDRGPGVPAEDRERIFEPFHRLDHDHPTPGTGIGLSLVARFAAAHGGRAWVEDGAAGGSRFVVELEDVQETAAADRTERSADAVPAASPS